MDLRRPINVGVIGFGYWGPNVARNFSQIDDAQVSHICDLDEERLARARRLYPHAHMTRNVAVVLDDLRPTKPSPLTGQALNFDELDRLRDRGAGTGRPG